MNPVPASVRPFVRVIVCTAIGLCGLAAPASAQRVDLSLSTSTISFPSADPDTTPSLAAPGVQVTYRIRQNASDAGWQITLLASGDLSSGLATIPVSNVTWTATPAPPFQSGTMSAMVAQPLAGGLGNVNPASTAYVSFFLVNSWSYDAGTYTTVFTFTLTAP
jgi:hypothetical protein